MYENLYHVALHTNVYFYTRSITDLFFFKDRFLDKMYKVLWEVNSVVMMGWQTKVGRSMKSDANTKQYCYRTIILMTTDVFGSPTLTQN